MKPSTEGWVRKAEGDYTIMLRENRAAEDPVWDGVCYHAQQCVEKYLKACLAELELEIPQIHGLSSLLRLLLPHYPLWGISMAGLERLTRFATATRYPGYEADEETAREAVALCREFRAFFKRHLETV